MSQIMRLSGCQNHRCAYCSVRLVLMPLERNQPRGPRRLRPPNGLSWPQYQYAKKQRRATRDHLIPRCFGGADNDDNLIVACLWCNNYRGNMPAEEAFWKIRRLVNRGTHPHIVFARKGYFPRDFCRPPTRPPADLPSTPPRPDPLQMTSPAS